MSTLSTNASTDMPLADRLCAAALALALPIALGSLPIFAFGYWSKAELLPILLHVTSALGALGLLIGLASGKGNAHAALWHPQVLVVALLAGWTVLAAPFVDLPLLSLAGTVQSGFGGLWFCDFAVLIACALTVKPHRRWWTGLRWWAIALTLVLAGLKLHDWLYPSKHLLIYVAAYYGWIGLAMAAAISFERTRRWPWALPLAGTLAAVAVVVCSLSMAALALLVIGAAFVAVGWWVRRTKLVAALTASRATAVVLVAVAAWLPYALLRWVPALGQVESLRDRQLLQKMIHAALSEQSAAGWLFGNGWGRVQDAYHGHLDVTGEVLWRPTWIFLESDYFHAHNWMLESLFGAGLPGVLLSLAALFAIPLFAAPERRTVATALAIAFAAMNAMWFPLSISLPFAALAIAAISRPATRVVPAPRVGMAALGIVLVLQLGFAAAQSAFIHNVGIFRAGGLDTFPADPRGSDLTAAEVIRDDLNTLAQAQRFDPDAQRRGLAMVRHLAQRIPHSTSSYFLVTAANALTRIYGTDELPSLASGIPEGKALWRTTVDRLLTVAPHRTDVAIPYLTHHAVIGELAEAARVTKVIRMRAPDDPVGLYFAGLLLVLEPGPEAKRQGIQFLRASKAAGIERFMPLDPAVQKIIGQ
ncbi:MAG: O-antigen ligase family protein [Bacteroidota bacterium]